ncbi:hypothetical protein GCM10009655_02860 [Rhodoglobus aureus]|uniref:Uncharacterized protein n=1 Tax=Rhodoglobus aureus TaxID=191497 RepID=A0ABP4G190_9MICO
MEARVRHPPAALHGHLLHWTATGFAVRPVAMPPDQRMRDDRGDLGDGSSSGNAWQRRQLDPSVLVAVCYQRRE